MKGGISLTSELLDTLQPSTNTVLMQVSNRKTASGVTLDAKSSGLEEAKLVLLCAIGEVTGQRETITQSVRRRRYRS